MDRFCKDIEFMTGRRTGLYWRICWGLVTPLLMVVILLYTFITYKPLTYKEYEYPEAVIGLFLIREYFIFNSSNAIL